ncbi:beta-ketoacyl synthase N-terminal-like domain-containing protein [Streptantibioticus silvisoli]|uniref:Polyketide synthase n=1 Tax=Streptantibioticus silvisoli TaxID=2705255 RepID=A0ABT6VV03_9ACTN|nr:polyketide synthase [Streptantibioticus silvisoli]MDI5962311.1 polyketide synthase [Streptantibioticus silvisoli]
MSERIAVVGYAVRLPGGDDLEDLDRFLMSGRSAVRTHARDELLEQGLDPAEIDDPRYVPRAAATSWTVESAKHIDLLSARERRVTDPQQLLFFDCCVAALEHAGIAAESVAGREVACVGGVGMGLYAGNELSSFFSRSLRHDGQLVGEAVPPEILVGNASDHTVGRVSYRLGLTGPSVNVQTACSTALASVEYACTLLRSGRVELALAGAAALYFPLKRGYQHERGGILSPGGVCRAFDADADGTVGGSGGGVFVLKRLADARRDGDAVHGVIEGVYQGSDGGARASYTAPAFDGQARVIRGALRDAGVEPSALSYVEAHGTGTPVGDLVELSALNEVFGGRDVPLPVGSVKPALGHLDTAAGVASLVNVLLGLRRGAMPGTVNLTRPDPALAGGVARPTAAPVRLRPAGDDGTVRVGISSFGASGTSVHAVVSDYAMTERTDPWQEPAQPPEPAEPPVAVPSGTRGGAPVADTGAAAEEPAAADPDAIRRAVLELLADRAAHSDELRMEDIGRLGAVDIGLDSVDLLAVAKVIEQRWGVRFEILDMLMFTSVDEMIDDLLQQAAGPGTS